MLPVTPHSHTPDTLLPADAEGRNRTYAQPDVTVDLQTIADPFGFFGLRGLSQRKSKKSEPLQLVALKRLAPLHILWLLLEPLFFEDFRERKQPPPRN